MKSTLVGILGSDDIPIPKPVVEVSKGVIALVMAFAFIMGGHPGLAEAVTSFVRPHAQNPDATEPSAHDLREMLWFARAVYSETKDEDEQRLVAWVIRNRVESARYPDTYEAVVLQKNQFSGLNTHDEQYDINVSLNYADTGRGWDSALAVARAVYHADDTERIIASGVMHFYSPISVRVTPSWAQGEEPVHVIHDTKSENPRFAFYADIR